MSEPIEVNSFSPFDSKAKSAIPVRNEGTFDLPEGFHSIGDSAVNPYTSNHEPQAKFQAKQERTNAALSPAKLQDDREAR